VSILEGGASPFRDDDGSADPRAAAALAAFGSGVGSEHAVLSALAATRLLVPIVAVPSEPEGRGAAWTEERGSLRPSDEGRRRLKAPWRRATRAQSEPEEESSAGDRPAAGPGRASGGDRGSEMSLPTLIGRDGRPAIPVFTCVDAVARWDAQARPVPALAGLVWRAAVEGSCAVVVDVAGPVPLAIDGARLAALAGGRPVPPPHQDPDVLAAVQAAAAGQPVIAGLRVTGDDRDPAADGRSGLPAAAVDGAGDNGAGDNGAGDLQIELTLAAGGTLAAGEEAARVLGGTLMEQLGGRLRRGITIAVTPPSGPSGGHPAGHPGS
jgi:SseB protein N-terminal domain